jgi:membrane protease YdiL (CAAX protease family)
MTQPPQSDPIHAASSYPPPFLLPPLVRFLIAAVWAAVVFWGTGFVYAIFPERNLVPGVLFRLIACVLTAAGFALFLRVLDGNPFPLPAALGLPLDGIATRQFATGLLLGALLITADVASIGCFGSLHFHLHLTRHMFVRAATVVFLLFCAALLEELTFRGYPFQKLTECLGAFWAVLVLSALFGALHLSNPDAQGLLSWGFFNTLAVGLLCALARIRSGSLWFPFGLHFGWNLFQGAVFGLPVSGLREFSSLVTASVQGSPSLTGGDYGPESSATCAIVLFLALPWLWFLTSSPQIQHRPPSLRPPSAI